MSTLANMRSKKLSTLVKARMSFPIGKKNTNVRTVEKFGEQFWVEKQCNPMGNEEEYEETSSWRVFANICHSDFVHTPIMRFQIA